MNCLCRPLLGRRINFNEIKEIVQEELYGSGSYLVYLTVWSHLIISGILLGRKNVRLALRELDAENVDNRQRRRLRKGKYRNPGLSYVCHIDGHDKFNLYGISIPRCTYEYSRHIV